MINHDQTTGTNDGGKDCISMYGTTNGNASNHITKVILVTKITVVMLIRIKVSAVAVLTILTIVMVLAIVTVSSV